MKFDDGRQIISFDGGQLIDWGWGLGARTFVDFCRVPVGKREKKEREQLRLWRGCAEG